MKGTISLMAIVATVMFFGVMQNADATTLLLDDGTGSTVAADSSGDGNTGTLAGLDPNTAWVAGVHGGALEFTSNARDAAQSVQSVIVPYSPNLIPTGAFTVQWWMNVSPTEQPSNEAYIFGTKGALAVSSRITGAWISVDMYFQNAGNKILWSANGDLVKGSWVHVAGVYDGTNARMFVNGVQRAIMAVGAGDSIGQGVVSSLTLNDGVYVSPIGTVMMIDDFQLTSGAILPGDPRFGNAGAAIPEPSMLVFGLLALLGLRKK